MGVAATAGLDATTTTVASFTNALTANTNGFTLVGTAGSISAAGLVLASDSTYNRVLASGHRGCDVSWRWQINAAPAGVQQVAYGSAAQAGSTNPNNADMISIRVTGAAAVEVRSFNAAGANTVLATSADGLLVTGKTYTLRLLITESGLLTLTVRESSSAATVYVADAVDVSATSAFTSASGPASVRVTSSFATCPFTLSTWREVSRPASEVLRAHRGALVQLSDGTSAWVNAVSTATSTVLAVWRDARGGGVAQIGSWTVSERMFSAPVLARDPSDNLYVAFSAMTKRHYRQLTKSGNSWSVGPANSVDDGGVYPIRALRWTSVGYLVALLYRGPSNVDAVFSGQVSKMAAGTFSDAGAANTAAAAAGRARIGLLGTDSDSAAAGILISAASAAASATITVARWTINSTGGITVTSLGTVTLNAMTLSLTRVGSQWVLTGANSGGQLVAHVISTTTIGAAVACTGPALAGDPHIGFGDATADTSRASRIMPSDYGASPVTSDYVRARFDPAAGSWTAPAAYSQVQGQAKELASAVSIGPLTLAPEITRSDGSTDWLLTSLGTPSAASGSGTYTVHDSDVPKASVVGQVRNGDGSAYTGGALVALVRSDGAVVATTTSSTADGTYTMGLPGVGTFELVAFSADGSLTAATGVKATA